MKIKWRNSINIYDTKRTFIAINLNRDIKEYIFKVQQRIVQIRDKCNMKVKFVERDNLHISLKFLGDLSCQEIEKTSAILQNVTKNYQHFRAELSENIGVFPNIARPRVIWIGIEKGNKIILNIYQSIEKELKSEQFYKKESQFKAHITLARIKYLEYQHKLSDYIKYIKVEPLSESVKTIELMESQLTKEGPIYTIIKSFPLSAQI